MFQHPDFHKVSPQLEKQLLPTNDHLLLRELRQIQQQTELMQRLGGACKNNLLCDSTLGWESQRESEEDSFELCRESQEEECSKISLLLDCRLKRMCEDSDILAEIMKKCSQKCAERVKAVFAENKQHATTIKQLQKELKVSKGVNNSLLIFKEENLSLKQRLASAERKLAEFNDANCRSKQLEERLAAKERAVNKLEQALMDKEIRLASMRKKVQKALEVATQRGTVVLEAIDQYNSQLSSLSDYECIDEIVRTIHQQANAVSSKWSDMAITLAKI